MKNLLVTGGCGFIGSNFVRLCLEPCPDVRLVNLDKLTYAGNLENLADIAADPRYRFIKGDIGDADMVERLFAEEAIDTVVHFAAESHVDRSIEGPAPFIQTNIVGTFTLLEAARKAWLSSSPLMTNGSRITDHGSRFLHVSTDEVYGSLGETGLFTETTPYDPRSPYSASKAASDHLVSAYHHTYGLPTLITNCSNNYGPYHFPEKLIPLMVLNALDGKPLPVYGDGSNVRDWLYVGDHCSAIRLVLARGRTGETYNIGGAAERKNLDVVKRVCAILDELRPRGAGRYETLINFVTDRPGHDWRYAMDTRKIERELGWRPAESFESGLRKTVEWYLANPEWVASIRSGDYRNWIETNYRGR